MKYPPTTTPMKTIHLIKVPTRLRGRAAAANRALEGGAVEGGAVAVAVANDVVEECGVLDGGEVNVGAGIVFRTRGSIGRSCRLGHRRRIAPRDDGGEPGLRAGDSDRSQYTKT
jgi:hypothetical protein